MSRYDDRQERENYGAHPPLTPRKRRRKWPWVLLAVAVVIVIVSVVSGSNTTQQTSSATGTLSPLPAPQSDPIDAPPPVTDDDTAGVVAFGAPFNMDGLQLTVTAPKAGDATLGETYCTTVSYVNGTDDAVDFNAFDWKLLDTDGVEASTGFKGTGKPGEFLGSGSLRPGGKKSGKVCFDKQGSGTPQQVIYQGGLFSKPVVWR